MVRVGAWPPGQAPTPAGKAVLSQRAGPGLAAGVVGVGRLRGDVDAASDDLLRRHEVRQRLELRDVETAPALTSGRLDQLQRLGRAQSKELGGVLGHRLEDGERS